MGDSTISDARAHLEKSIELDPAFTAAHYELALLLKEQGASS